ncbi:MAG: hypothetical protein HFG54_02075 [Lachnospiraceae bacterium]|nr:hypothetical protein [Lachnospiraceae bacterium]
MDLNRICIQALNYSGEKFLSRIVKNDKRWIISMCDEEGHDLFVAPISIDVITGELDDYSPIDEIDDGYVDVDIPKEYLSKKGKIIYSVIEYGDYKKDNISILDTIYEKYNLYNAKPTIAFSILNYYLSIISHFEKTSISSDAYRYVIDDDRSFEILCEESKEFRFIPNDVRNMQELLEELLIRSYNKSAGIEISDQDQLIKEAHSMIRNTGQCNRESYMYDDETESLIEELKTNILMECDYISGKTTEMSELLKQKVELVEKYKKNRNALFGNTPSFTKTRFLSEGEQ